MVKLSPEEMRLICDAIQYTQNVFHSTVIAQVGHQPPAASAFMEKLNRLKTSLNGRDSHLMIDAVNLPPIKLAIFQMRRMIAADVDETKARIVNAEVLDMIDAKLRPWDKLIESEWMDQTAMLRMPALRDYLTLKHTEEVKERLHPGQQLRPREFDEKFHILQAPSLFIPDLSYFRNACVERGASVVVAYSDIDDFKKFNSTHSEHDVDRHLLPRFMEAVEAHVFGHGYAYRYGGDEYVLLLPNMATAAAVTFLNALREKIRSLDYINIPEHTTLSIGFCEVTPETFLTEREIEAKANRAKAFAKAQGKDRIATFKGGRFRDEDLYVPANSA